jgi:hypothetical protein
MGVILTKSTSVLDKISDELDYLGFISFESSREDESDRFRLITIDQASWHDFGHPDRITITIVPGDTLNP